MAGTLLACTFGSIVTILVILVTTTNGAPTSAQCAANLPIKNWASLGDSYSNIVGGGLQDYEALMATDPCLQGKKPQYLSNPDATISMVSSQQVPKLLQNTNFVTLSAGANDIGLVQILDACVYNFIGSASLDCTRLLAAAATFMSSAAFASSWNNVLTSARSVLARNSGKLHVVGNAAFFDETTPSCTQTSLAVYAGAGQQKYLNPTVRKNLNELIHRFNWWQNYLVAKYNRAQVPGENIRQYPVQYIDSDDRFNGHRLCRAGIAGTGSGDINTWFATGDGLKTPITRAPYTTLKPPATCNPNGGWNEYATCRMAKSIQRTSYLTLTKSGSGTRLNNWERIMHPTTQGQDAIRDEIVSQIAQGPTLSGYNLRILPLGASIIAGAHSTDGNGFRKTMYETLRKTNTVTFVGSQGKAPLVHEGRPGWIIKDVDTVAGVSLPSRPNVVLIHVGTNDLLTNTNIDQAPERLGALIDHVTSVATDAVVLVSQLIPSSRTGAFEKFVTFNARMANIINQRQVRGRKVMKVFMPVTTDDLVDGIHPNDAGYNKMGQAWIQALQRAAGKGWIDRPVRERQSSTASGNLTSHDDIMASKLKTMAPMIGSMPWLDQENQQISQFSAQEADDFAFSVRNELDFLNEHMADIFNKNHVNITEVFKTPGKLRGKTPRTARKRNPLEVREPLNDIFAPNSKLVTSPSRDHNVPKAPRQFGVAQDTPLSEVEKKTKTSHDSGYHGMTEDEMDVDERGAVPLSDIPQQKNLAFHALLDAPKARTSREQSAFDVSFHSAKEELARESAKVTPDAPAQRNNTPQAHEPQTGAPAVDIASPEPQQTEPSKDTAMETEAADKDSVLDEDVGDGTLPSASAGSSPAIKGLVRKSSLTFATLPAREPLTTKKSIGARLSRASYADASKNVMGRGSFLGRITGDKSLGGPRQPEVESETYDNNHMALETNEPDREAKVAKLHNKSSTQRLHDRINMLGKSQPPARPTKSIPATATLAQPPYPDLPLDPAPHKMTEQSSKVDEEDDDWIKPPPMRANESPRPMLSKSVTVDVMENLRGMVNISDQEFGKNYHEMKPSPRRHSLSMDSESGPPNVNGPADQPMRSTTPTETPASTRYADGPLSASKSKLQSIMKTARGLFTSSAGASAQAKMELWNHAEVGSPLAPLPSKPTDQQNDTGMYPTIRTDEKLPSSFNHPLPNPARSVEGRKTRGSIEKEKKERERQQTSVEHEKLVKTVTSELVVSTPEQGRNMQDLNAEVNGSDKLDEPVVATSNQPLKVQEQATRKSPRRTEKQQETDIVTKATQDDVLDNVTATINQPPPSSNQSQLQRPNTKRPIKPAKEPASKPEPQRVAIRVGTLSQRIPLTNAALSSGLQDSLPPSTNKRPGLGKKTSTASMQTAASNTSLRSAVSSKPKALIAAERKKEQDEKEVQRKLEQKKEIERKRAVQQEEARRQEQAQREEADRQRERDRAAAAEDPKKIAQRQAIEKRRQELAKKEQQRTASFSLHQAPANTRPELGSAKPTSKMQTAQDSSRPAPNQVKAPIKRVFESEADEPMRQSRLPGGQQYQPMDAKRRRTNDETSEEPSVRPTMAPPKRQSNLLKDVQRPFGPSLMGPPSSMANGYSHAKPTIPHHPYQPQYQHPGQIQRPGQVPDMAKYANGRIVFAENTNTAYPPHKTPNQSRLTNQPLAKSSPQYVNGENIQLEDIPTDSDEDDSDHEDDKKAKGAMLPSWVQSPILNDLLRDQEKNKDPDSIFGPSAAVNMEEMFKERHHRFRSRTSSANWAGNDRLTEEEIRSDNAARERMRREGGWTFGL
ncbi:MAG: hypothetical protein Q9171_004520 [Xanthocarpia ochracea]